MKCPIAIASAVKRLLGDWENAKVHLAESLRMAQELDIFRFQSLALSNLGWIALHQQDSWLAYQHCPTCLALPMTYVNELACQFRLKAI